METGSVTEGVGHGFINFNGGILRATGNQTDFLSNFKPGEVQIQSGGAFIDTQTYSVGISAPLQGSGGITKQGTGTLTLSGFSGSTGVSAVQAGTLAVTGSVMAVTVQSGGKIAPGVSSIGTLNTLGETWNSGGTCVWNTSAHTGTPGTDWSLISINGELNIAATSKFTISINDTGLVTNDDDCPK
jgi:autotransporter-associated beta strand protein